MILKSNAWIYLFKGFRNKVIIFRPLSDNRVKLKVRVRFAPSPTGYLHLGGLRTALYNHLFARAHNGTFVLRIEDTDQSRLMPDAVKKLEYDLSWAGIVSDESPLKGGAFGPYMQSKRLQLYREQVARLLESGAAYCCFCTDRRLDLLRHEALRARQVPRYDNKCRYLSAPDVQQRVERGDQHCVRFKLSPTPEPFHDLVYGPITYDVAAIEGDPVIFKSDGFPTYHLANVVDDHFMEISHVLRGVEWQISTNKHLLLYRAFGWTPPVFGHLPLILNADGSKLSKRQGDIRVESYREDGVFPIALLNFVTHAGGGFDRDLDGVRSTIYSLQELVEQFDLKRVNPSSCRLMPEKLGEFNSLELQRQMSNETQMGDLVKCLREIVQHTFQDRLENQKLQLQDDHIRSVLLWGQKRIKRLKDLVDSNLAFLWVMPSSSNLQADTDPENIIDILNDLKQHILDLSESSFCKEQLKTLLQEFAAKHEFKFSRLMKLLRSVLSGLKEGPGVAEMMEILGPSSTVSRLEQAIGSLKLNVEKHISEQEK